MPFSKATHPTAAGGGCREDLLAQRSKFCVAISKQRILGTARGTSLLGCYPQITGQRPIPLGEPTDIFARSIRESVIGGYTL